MVEAVQTIYRKDYQPPAYLVEKVQLDFDLHEDHAIVSSQLSVSRNPVSDNTSQPDLILDGVELELLELKLDGKLLTENQFELTEDRLLISQVPEQFVLNCKTRIYPAKNTSLEGLYKSRTMFCTQCEAEGFRKITYFPDRPDVMSEYTVSITANKNRYPILLSNGNDIAREELEGGRHKIVWHDPFPKPSYLFALVAADLQALSDTFTTMSGKQVQLHIYVEPKDLDKIDFAMDSLKRSMRWDEQVYGREYDLDLFNIVAVDDFNMGAMENKSLNIFNTSCVLAHPQTTTDAGFQRVEAVVAHEYFHNWSGNRVTCRDWFQLSLKEGFTVYRDAEFSADMGSRTVKRVEDATLLRSLQFAEDAGPMAHPIRPDSYMDISNFYTLTVYEKGAEVVRMIANILGPENFRKGSDLYFERHDGQAVTCEDFVLAMEHASGKDLSQFRHWYSQAGTPKLTVISEYDQQANTYTLTFEQSCPATPGQPEKPEFHIPVKVSLIAESGALPLILQSDQTHALKNDGEGAVDSSVLKTELTLDVREKQQQFVFANVPEQPVPSLLRSFSAPVKIAYPYSRDELLFLMTRDTDGFNRWDASQQLAFSILKDMISNIQQDEALNIDERLSEAYRAILADDSLDPAMVAHMLRLPLESWMSEQFEIIDAHAIFNARLSLQKQIANTLQTELLNRFQQLQQLNHSQQVDEHAIAGRSLKNACLSYLALNAGSDMAVMLESQYQQAGNMTDRFAALMALVHSESADYQQAAEHALKDFIERFRHESLVVNQWFQVQCSNPFGDGLSRLQALMKHDAFDFNNPNKLRATLAAFAGTPVQFHQQGGAAYRVFAQQILTLNHSNPQIASRLLTPLTRWKRYPEQSGQLMRAELQKLIDSGELAKDVYEVVSKSLS